jgi:hypothetical protein
LHPEIQFLQLLVTPHTPHRPNDPILFFTQTSSTAIKEEQIQ